MYVTEIAMSYFRMSRGGTCFCPWASNAGKGYGFTLRWNHIYHSSEILPRHFFSVSLQVSFGFSLEVKCLQHFLHGDEGRRRQAVEGLHRVCRQTFSDSHLPPPPPTPTPHYSLSPEPSRSLFLWQYPLIDSGLLLPLSDYPSSRNLLNLHLLMEIHLLFSHPFSFAGFVYFIGVLVERRKMMIFGLQPLPGDRWGCFTAASSY